MAAPVKLSCRHIWKLFGNDAEAFLSKSKQPPTLDEIKQAGLIAAVRNANIDIHEGETFVIMGLSGSGKSTLVRCLSRLIEPTAGELLFEGKDLRAASDNEMIEIRRHKMGMVFQHFDEAIRLADRIAVMKDGEVIQIATPEQLVLNPATDYVEEFTRHIPRSKIVTIGSIMSSVKVAVGEKILASATVDEVSRTVVESKQALPVVNPEDQIIGSIGREAVINVLVNGELN